jgi:hypothetical protein
LKRSLKAWSEITVGAVDATEEAAAVVTVDTAAETATAAVHVHIEADNLN